MKERLELLHHAKVISAESAAACIDISKLIENRLGIAPENEQFQMAITHLARAFDRISEGSPITDGLDEEMFREITEDPDFLKIEQLNKEILERLAIDPPAAENSFFLSNLMSLHYAAEASTP